MAPSEHRVAPRTPELVAFAQEVADTSRAAMLMALMDGRSWTVGELARQAGIAPNTASGHVRRLVHAQLLTEFRQGRHCYVRLAGAEVATAVEAMSLAAPTRPATPSLRGRRHDAELVAGRTCYHHLAGQLGVGLLDTWSACGFFESGWQLTDVGTAWFAELGVDTTREPRREFIRPCLDWTERRLHAAGTLADRFTAAAFERGWVVRGTHPRAVRLTPLGARHLPGGSP